jgi:segregation and condensation protein B
MQYLINQIEALIFATPSPLKVEEINSILNEYLATEIPKNDIEEAIISLKNKYKSDDFSFELVKSGGGYQMMTKPIFHPILATFLKQQSKKQLSKSALETLSIIAYKQPVTKGMIEEIRGTSADYAVQKLLERDLIEIKGKAESVGNPILYGTTEKFMEYFGIDSLEDLPQPQDFGEKSEDS